MKLLVRTRILWFLVFVGAVGISSFYIYKIWNTSRSSPIIISMDATGEDISLVPFPAVTICPINKFSRKKWERLLKEETIPGNWTIEQLSRLGEFVTSSFAFWDKSQYESMINKYKGSELDFSKLLSFLQKTAYVVDDVTIHCQFQGGKKNCTDMFRPMETDEAFCFSFNSRVLENELRSRNTDGGGAPAGFWTASPFQGLSVILDTNRYDAVGVGREMMNGLKVLIHDPNDLPEGNQHGFVLNAGQEVDVIVTLTKMDTTAPVKDIPQEKRHCCFNEDRELVYFKRYSRSYCDYDCLSRYLEFNHTCGCKPFYRKVPLRMPHCDLDAYECIRDLAVSLQKNESLCDCCIECNSVMYEYMTSYAIFPGYGFTKSPLPRQIAALRNDSKFADPEYTSNNLARVQVNWGQQKVLIRKRSIRFSWEDLVASIGGLLGFGTGFSLLSGFEVIYFVFIRYTLALIKLIRN